MSSLIKVVAVTVLAINPLLISSASPLRRTPDEHEPSAALSEEFFSTPQITRLLEQEEEGQYLGQRCGRNTECIDSLTCTEGAWAKRCMPSQDCLEQRLAAFEQQYGDFQEYKDLVLSNAGTSYNELAQQIQQQSNPQPNDFAASQSTSHSVVESMEQTMAEPLRELRAIMTECGVTSTLDTNTNSTHPKQNGDDSPTQDVPPVDFVGYHLEGGLFLTGSFSYIEAKTESGYVQAFYRLCFGLESGGGAEFSFLYGRYPLADDVQVLHGFSFLGSVDLGAVFHVSGGGGVRLNNEALGYFEIGFGLGLGFGAGGAVCYAWPSNYDGGVPPFPIPLPFAPATNKDP